MGYHNFVQPRPELRERVIFIDSLSKTYGMPGWRVGFMAGPEAVAQAIVTMNSNHITNIPEIVSAAAVAALSRSAGRADGQERRVPGQARPGHGGDGCDSGRGLPASAGRVLRVPGHQRRLRQDPRPSGTEIGNDVDFCNALLEAKGVACVPGSAFGEPRALRISYTCPTPQLAPGLQRIQEFFAELS